MTIRPHTLLRTVGLISAAGLAATLATPLAASANPFFGWGQPYRSMPAPRPVPLYTPYSVQQPTSPPAYDHLVEPSFVQAQQMYQLQQQAQRCNTGRLVGGLVGGGLGYGISRGDGRTWAVPLGALVGSQMGCSVGQGYPPRPW